MSMNQYLINELKDYLPKKSFTEDLKIIYEYIQQFYNVKNNRKELNKIICYLIDCYFKEKEQFKNEVEKIKQFIKNRNK